MKLSIKHLRRLSLALACVLGLSTATESRADFFDELKTAVGDLVQAKTGTKFTCAASCNRATCSVTMSKCANCLWHIEKKKDAELAKADNDVKEEAVLAAINATAPNCLKQYCKSGKKLTKSASVGHKVKGKFHKEFTLTHEQLCSDDTYEQDEKDAEEEEEDDGDE